MTVPTDTWSLKRRFIVTQSLFGGAALVVCLLAPLIGSTNISLARVFDTSIPYVDNVDAQIFFHRAFAEGSRGSPGRRRARFGRGCAASPAAKPTGHTVHAGCLGRRLTRGDDSDHSGRDIFLRRYLGSAIGELCWIASGGGYRLRGWHVFEGEGCPPTCCFWQV